MRATINYFFYIVSYLIAFKTDILVNIESEQSIFQTAAPKGPENGRKQTETESDNVCTTPACLRTSHAILSAIDSTVDPCQDFYQYACGRWPLRNPTTRDLPFSSTTSQLQRIVLAELKTSLGINPSF